MQIKAFSDFVGVPVDTIRYYEKMGLLNPKRLENGYRDYDDECIAHLKMIVVLKHLGFSLKEISRLIQLQMKEISPECNQETVELFDQKIKQLTDRIQFYQQALETLKLAKNLMKDQQYEKNQKEIERSIDSLFRRLKEGD